MEIIKLRIFSHIPNLIHGFSTRHFGNMHPSNPHSQTSWQTFTKAIEINPPNIIKMDQVHSNTITWVTEKNKAQTIKQTDGLLTNQKNLFLTVMTADCVPLLFFDPQKNYTGVAHAGWKGVYTEIAKEMIKQMVNKGSNPQNILVGIGPCIRVCCYNINKQRAKQFTDKFGKANVIARSKTTKQSPEDVETPPQSPRSFVTRDDMNFFLDLPNIIKQQLITVGIPAQNIQDLNICTADNLDKFFSYRKEGQTFGEFIGIIGRG